MRVVLVGIRRRGIKTTQSNHRWAVAANLLDRNFAPAGLSKVWVSDITYIPSAQGWLYLTTVMDLGDRQILGWSLSDGMSAEQTSIAAFKQAVVRQKGNCWDNAPAESFFKTLKYELDMPNYQSYQQARSATIEFIEIWYNRKRLHSALKSKSGTGRTKPQTKTSCMITLNRLSTFLLQV